MKISDKAALIHARSCCNWCWQRLRKRNTPSLLPSNDHRPTAQARVHGTSDPVLRSLSICCRWEEGALQDDLLQGLQQHPRAMQVMGSVTELKLVGAVG